MTRVQNEGNVELQAVEKTLCQRMQRSETHYTFSYYHFCTYYFLANARHHKPKRNISLSSQFENCKTVEPYQTRRKYRQTLLTRQIDWLGGSCRLFGSAVQIFLKLSASHSHRITQVGKTSKISETNHDPTIRTLHPQ